MPSSLKKRVRARRLKTGENWQTAERHVRAEGQRARADGSASAASPPVADDSAHDEEHAAVADDGAHDEEYEAVADRAPAGLVRDEEAEEDFDGDLETEECATRAEAESEAARFARGQSRQGYQVGILRADPGVVSVLVKRAIGSPDEDFAEDEKRFTFPAGDDDGGEDTDRAQGAKADGDIGDAPVQIATVPELARALALPLPQLDAFTAADADSYRHFTLPKRDRSRRAIAAPAPRLMAVQRRILKLIVSRLPAHEASHGYRVGRSAATNAAVHVNSKLVVTLDLRDFASQITLPRVLGIFRHAGYPEPVAQALALLCTAPDALGVRRLPQGAPTTPGLSNAVCSKLDRRLAGLASSNGWRYTRYGDDLTFSLPEGDADTKADEVLGTIGRIVADEGFRLNTKKTRVARTDTSQRVTGLVVNGPGAPRVPREVRRNQRAAAYNLRRKSSTAGKPE